MRGSRIIATQCAVICAGVRATNPVMLRSEREARRTFMKIAPIIHGRFRRLV